VSIYGPAGIVDVTPAGGASAARKLFLTTDTLGAGATYDSGIFPLAARGWSQVQTEVVSDTDGTLLFDFHADSAGVQTIRQLSVPYSAADGYRLFAAPAFSPYVQYRFVNSATPQTSFYFTTKTLSTAISPQSLAVDAFLSPAMIANVSRAVTVGADPSGTYRNVGITEDGDLRVALSDPLTGFGEVRVSEVHPIAQIDAVYGLLPNVETFVDTSPGTGSVSAVDGNFVCQTGAGIGGYGVVRTRRGVRYRAGQGVIFRFTVAFDDTNKVANSLQAAGPFNTTNGFLVGYDGTQFGVMHRTGGRHEIRTLTISVAASGAETLNLQLNGVTYNIPVTAGSIPHNAYEVAAWLNANQSAWDAYQNASTVALFGRNAGPLSGAYSVTNGGGGETIAGGVAQDGAGVANSEQWVYQSSFNVDKLDGTGPSGMTIDTETGNVFEVGIQYLGYGNVQMKIENPVTGQFFTFHRYQFANDRTTPTLLNPTLKVGWVAASLGSATNLTVKGASALGGIDGLLHPLSRPKAFSYQRGSVGATLTSVFSIRVRSAFRGVVQLSEVLPRIAYVSPEGTKAAEVKFLLNPTFDAGAAEPDWQYVNETDSIVETDNTGETFTDTGDELASFVVAGGTSGSLNFVDLAESSINPVHLERGDVLCIAARITGGGGTNVTASLTWLED